MKRIMIDPGHGGTDPGAINGAHQEAALALDISMRLLSKLISAGYSVNITRKNNGGERLSNSARCIQANQFKADIFIAVHLNAAESSKAKGHEIIYCPGSDRGRNLARAISAELPGWDRGIKTDLDLGRGFKFAVLWKTKMPAVIVEACFISNTEDLKFILDPKNRDKIAVAVTQGVINFFRQEDALTEGGY
jgi:N-acetylmuramoyl-L-alanine amidase